MSLRWQVTLYSAGITVAKLLDSFTAHLLALLEAKNSNVWRERAPKLTLVDEAIRFAANIDKHTEISYSSNGTLELRAQSKISDARRHSGRRNGSPCRAC